MLAEDGSGKGAGLVSAIAQRIYARNVSTTIESEHNGKVMNGIAKAIDGLELHSNERRNGLDMNGVANGRC